MSNEEMYVSTRSRDFGKTTLKCRKENVVKCLTAILINKFFQSNLYFGMKAKSLEFVVVLYLFYARFHVKIKTEMKISIQRTSLYLLVHDFYAVLSLAICM